ncbi:MarR family winged helix-turn-helix transcriptional regulator [uncultured Paracoccus sp.]|uniref:MarR family winged helix-turn-helix transcriptional regulator n=1 Tax=uncultured Paracoccus sp. TaxID=189685 RepID=UPI00262F08C7|nr:MarR family winged helix-turn-helix transcriptional regulator [uncultured Paracoccus sp.]
MTPSADPDPDRPEDDYVLSDQIGYLFRLANQRHSSIFMERTILDLTPTQFSALVRLAELGECSQNQLGRATAMDVATIKGVVGRLKAKGLVELAADPNDKRRLIVSLAPGQGDLIARLGEIGAEITRETLSPLTPAEQRSLLRLLKKLT